MGHKPGDKERHQDLWLQLRSDLPDPVKLDHDIGIWGDLRFKPGGVWKEAREETISLAHARTQKTSLWHDANDETLILPREGRINIFRQVDEHLSKTTTPDPVEDTNLWDALDQETVILPRVKRSLPRIRTASRLKPIRITGWALKELKTVEGETYWVLKNDQRGTYLRLNEQQVHFWEKMDGAHTLQDLAVSMFVKYKTLSIDGLTEFIAQLEENGFLVGAASIDVYQAAGAQTRRRSVLENLKGLARFLLRSEFSFKNVDRFYSNLYRVVGRVIFSRLFIIPLSIVGLVGIPAYVVLTLRGELSLLGNADSTLLGLVTLWLAQIFAFFLHESGHALTTKHYGRTVPRAGFGIYLGLPAFFVDTTDIWMEPRGPRILVTWAGPMTGFVLSGITSIVLLIAPATAWAGFGYQFATFCMLGSLINLNPLLKYDGYFILMDWLEIPMLRKKSLEFVARDFLLKLRTKERLTRQEKLFAIYGVGAALFTGFSIVSVLVLYGKQIGRFVSWVISVLP